MAGVRKRLAWPDCSPVTALADGNGFGNATLLFDQNTGGTLAQQQVTYGQYKVNQLTGRVDS